MKKEPTQESKIKMYQCSYPACLKMFREKNYLIVHMRIHTGERPFSCTYKDCTKSFLTTGNLKSHLNFHLGIKTFVCSYTGCGKAYSQKSKLNAHLRIHLGIKPYQCLMKGCNKEFNYIWNLKSHEMIHSGLKPYKCYIEDCDMSFAHSNELQCHLKKNHQGNSGFYCPLCPLEFSRYNTVMIHMANHKLEQKEKLKSKLYFNTTKENTNVCSDLTLNDDKYYEMTSISDNNFPYNEFKSSLTNLDTALRINSSKEDIEFFDSKLAQSAMRTVNQFFDKPATEFEQNLKRLFSIRTNAHEKYSLVFDTFIKSINL